MHTIQVGGILPTPFFSQLMISSTTEKSYMFKKTRKVLQSTKTMTTPKSIGARLRSLAGAVDAEDAVVAGGAAEAVPLPLCMDVVAAVDCERARGSLCLVDSTTAADTDLFIG